MDIEKLIKRLKCPQIQSCPMDGEYPSCKTCQKDLRQEVITALSTLQTKNKKLRDELEQVKKKNKYSAHDVSLILSDVFGDSCACNFNGNDEWLPEKCELLDTCPDVVGVACWEQYLKWRDQKEE